MQRLLEAEIGGGRMTRRSCQPTLGLVLLLVMVPLPRATAQPRGAEVERVQALRRAMSSERPAVRALVLVELARRAGPDPTLVKLILPRLSSPEPTVVIEAAIRALGLLGQAARSAVPALVRFLADPRVVSGYHQASPLLRQVCDVLQPHGQVAGVELTRALSSRSAIQRANAARCLAEPGLASASTLSPLLGLLTDADGNVRQRVLDTLAVIGRENLTVARTIARSLLKDDDWSGWAVQTLSQLGAVADPFLERELPSFGPSELESLLQHPRLGRRTFALLERRLADPRKRPWKEVLRPLMGVDRTPAWPTLVPRLLRLLATDRDESVRSSAARLLAPLTRGRPGVVRGLIRALRDEDDDVQEAAAEALGQAGSDAAPAIPELLRAVRSGNGVAGSSRAAFEALVRLGAAVVPTLLRELRRGHPAAGLALHLLTKLGSEAVGVAAEMVKLLADPRSDADTQEAAVRVLRWGRGDPTATPPLLVRYLARATHCARREAALLAIASYPERRAVAIRAVNARADLTSKHPDCPGYPAADAALVTALGSLGAGGLPGLKALILGRAHPLTRPALDALARIAAAEPSAWNEGVAFLVSQLGAHSERVRRAAIEAFRLLGLGVVPSLLTALRGQDPRRLDGVAQALAQVDVSAGAGARPAATGSRLEAAGPPGRTSGQRRIVKQLLPLFADTEPRVRHAAVLAAAVFGPEVAVPVLLEALTDPRGEVRSESLHALGRLGRRSPEALLLWLPEVLARLTDPQPRVRTFAAVIPGVLGRAGAHAEQRLLVALRDPSSRVRAAAAFSLGQVATDRTKVIPALVRLQSDPALEGRYAACLALLALGRKPPDPAPLLVAALQDDLDWIRVAALDALLGVSPSRLGRGAGSAEALRLVAALLGDPSVEVARHAATTLGHLGPLAGPAVPALIRALEHPDPDVVASVVTALARVGRPAVAALLARAENPRERARSAVLLSLAKMRPAPAEALSVFLKLLVAPPGERLLQAAEEGLVGLGGLSVPSLIPLLGSTSVTLRGRAAALLARLGSAARPALPALIRTLKDDDLDVGCSAADAIGEIGRVAGAADSAIPALIDLLQRRIYWRTQRTVVSALVRLGASAVPDLILLLRSKGYYDTQRVAAARALSLMGTVAGPAVSALVDALRDPSALVRGYSAVALGRLSRVLGRHRGAAVSELKRLVDADRSVPGGADCRAWKGRQDCEDRPDVVPAATVALRAIGR